MPGVNAGSRPSKVVNILLKLTKSGLVSLTVGASTLNLEAVRNFQINETEQTYARRDTILYALGLGYGSDPVDPAQLKYVYERDLKAVPSICGVLAHPGFWAKEPTLEIDWIRMLHGEQSFEIHSPIPPEGTVIGTYNIVAIEDKGPGKGAIIHQSKDLRDKATGRQLATVNSVLFARGDGGCGNFGTPQTPALPLPSDAPSMTCEFATLPQSALIYRLSGDYNPIHVAPAAAMEAGFDRPILHGLCTFGIATRAIIATLADDTPDHLASVSVRFTKPAFPGETIRTEFFGSGNKVQFRSKAVERDVIVLDHGLAQLLS